MSKAEKEAALNARIAAIRAKNEALKRRHAEVQADKQEAEKLQSSVTKEEEEEPSFSPRRVAFERRKPPSHQNGRSREDERKKGPKGGGPPPKGTRLKGSPPPDPSYRFLADRMRDASSSSSSEEREDEASPSAQGSPERLKGPEKRRETPFKTPQDENRSPSRKKGNNRRQQSINNNGVSHEENNNPDERNGLILREIRADSVTTKYISGEQQPHQRVGSSSKRHSIKRGGSRPPNKAHDSYIKESITSPHEESPGVLVAEESNPVEWTTPDTGSWSDWTTEYYSPSEWQLPPTSWAEEIAREEASTAASSQENWYGTAPMQYVSMAPHFVGGGAPNPPTQYGLQPIYPAEQEYYGYHYQQIPHQGSVMLACNGLKSVPLGDSTPPTPRGHPKGGSSYQQHNFKNNRHHNGSRSDNWRSRGEISKIPPRFQKQKPSEGYYHRKQVNNTSSLNIPKASSSDPPPGCDRLTIFGIPKIVDRLGDLQLFPQLSQRGVSVLNLADFKSSLSQIQPEKDFFLALHVLDNDARDIAGRSSRTDLEKGIDSDNLANEFCDIIEAILDKIPYLKIFISTLLPRFDSPESQGLSFPNNVRKVMNVQISTRLKSNPKVFFLNNDQTLDHISDEVKMLSLYTGDGHTLSEEGFGSMMSTWSKGMEDFVTEEKIVLPLKKEGGKSGDLIKDFQNMDVREEEKKESPSSLDTDLKTSSTADSQNFETPSS